MTAPGDSPRDRRDEDAGFWTPRPDPTILTTEAVERATGVFRREIQALRETLETRLAGIDGDRARIWERLRDLPAIYETANGHLRGEWEARGAAERELVGSQIAALRAELEQRITGMDDATRLLASNVGVIHVEIEKSARALKEIIETRLSGMDEATKLLATNVDKVPYAILQEAGNLKAFIMSKIDDVSHVSDEKFRAVDALFASNALALSAALAAQEKAVAAQNDSNTLAIRKSEDSTKETIAANLLAAKTGLDSLAAQLTDIKERVVRIESGGAGAAGQRADARLNMGNVIAAVAALVALVALVLYITKK